MQLFDERFEHLGVCGLHKPGGREHLRLRLRRQVAQIGLDVVVERQIESSVDPRRDRVNRTGGGPHLPSEPPLLDSCHFQEDRRNQLVLGLEVTVERAGAQLRPIENRSDTESLNALLANGFRCGGHDRASHPGIGSKLLASARAWAGHGSRGRVIGGEVFREPFAHTFWRQAVVGQFVIVYAAGTWPVLAGPLLD